MTQRLTESILLVLLLAVAAWSVGCQQESSTTQTGSGSPEPMSHVRTSGTEEPTPIATHRSDPTPSPTPIPRFKTMYVDETISPCGPSFIYPDVTFYRHFVHWAKGNSYLVFDLEDTVWTVDVEGTSLRQVADAYPGSERSLPGDGELHYGYHADATQASSRIVYATCEYSVEGSLGYEIGTVNVDGTDRKRLTTSESFENYPVWSPDGTRIAYIASFDGMYNIPGHYPPGGGDLYTMARDGTEIRELKFQTQVRGGAGLHPPVWSPDGHQLAFIVNESEGDTDAFRKVVYTIRADGAELRRIGETTGLPGWSPDGQEIAFARDDGAETGIYRVRADGSELRQVIEGFGASQVSWSPDGSSLLFVSGGRAHVVDLDGSNLRGVGSATAAAWSSDGSRIAVYFPGELLATMDRDGTNLRVLAEGGGSSLRLSSTSPKAPVDLAACSNGLAVPEPEANPGLVRDCEILLGLRDALSGQVALRWNEETPITEWQGIALGGSPPHVHELKLRNIGLTGILPPELGLLEELRKLDLATRRGEPRPNRLSGTIPPELGRLSKLEELRLDSNFLNGRIPLELGQLNNLRLLALDGNSLIGSIPTELTELSRLVVLDLAYNLLTGTIPPELGDLSSLTSLRLSGNRLTGPIPPEIGGIGRLVELSLSGNRLSGSIPPELGKLWVLHTLHLNGNELSGSIPSEMDSYQDLKTLMLLPNNLSGCVPAGVPDIWVGWSGLPRCTPERTQSP